MLQWWINLSRKVLFREDKKIYFKTSKGHLRPVQVIIETLILHYDVKEILRLSLASLPLYMFVIWARHLWVNSASPRAGRLAFFHLNDCLSKSSTREKDRVVCFLCNWCWLECMQFINWLKGCSFSKKTMLSLNVAIIKELEDKVLTISIV